MIGGLGPETTTKLYLSIVRKFREIGDGYPAISIFSIPVPSRLEEDIIRHSRNEDELLPYLLEGVRQLKKNSSFVVIPCNTAHAFLDILRKEAGIPLLDIIEETAKRAKEGGFHTVGILATNKTIEKGLFDRKLGEFGITTVKPDLKERRDVTELIYAILHEGERHDREKSKEALKKIISNLQKRGAEAVILGCTDLQLVIGQEDSRIPLLDSLEILSDAVIGRLSEKDKL